MKSSKLWIMVSAFLVLGGGYSVTSYALDCGVVCTNDGHGHVKCRDRICPRGVGCQSAEGEDMSEADFRTVAQAWEGVAEKLRIELEWHCPATLIFKHPNKGKQRIDLQTGTVTEEAGGAVPAAATVYVAPDAELIK